MQSASSCPASFEDVVPGWRVILGALLGRAGAVATSMVMGAVVGCVIELVADRWVVLAPLPHSMSVKWRRWTDD